MASSINSIFGEFRELSSIKDVFINKFFCQNKFEIKIQCIDRKIHLLDETRRLEELCVKHGKHFISCPWDSNFEMTKILSIKPM